MSRLHALWRWLAGSASVAAAIALALFARSRIKARDKQAETELSQASEAAKQRGQIEGASERYQAHMERVQRIDEDAMVIKAKAIKRLEKAREERESGTVDALIRDLGDL